MFPFRRGELTLDARWPWSMNLKHGLRIAKYELLLFNANLNSFRFGSTRIRFYIEISYLISQVVKLHGKWEHPFSSGYLFSALKCESKYQHCEPNRPLYYITRIWNLNNCFHVAIIITLVQIYWSIWTSTSTSTSWLFLSESRKFHNAKHISSSSHSRDGFLFQRIPWTINVRVDGGHIPICEVI